MKVLLINPPWYFETGQTAPTFSLGLAYIAAVLRKKHEIALIDADAEGVGWKGLEKRIRAFSPDVLGITATTSTYRAGLRLARIAKEGGNCFTVMGGPHVSAIPHQTLEGSGNLDAACRGEGEYTMLDVLDCLEKGEPLKGVSGISYREGKRIVHNTPRNPIKNLDELPFPARDLLPMKQHHRTLWGHPAGHIFSSRGCPNKCTFCASHTIFGSAVRFRSPENVVKEIGDMVKRFGITQFAFSDDTFTYLPDRVNKICDGIIKSGWDVKWVCQARVNTVNYNMLKKMKNAGCVQIDYGVESGDPDVLKKMRKNINHDQVKRAVRMTNLLGIRTFAYYILGTPYDTIESTKRTIKFARKLGASRSYFNILVPYPGTEMYNQAKAEGSLLIDDWSDFYQEKSVLRLKIPEWYLYRSYKKAKADLFLTELFREIRRFHWREVLNDLKRGASFFKRKVRLD